MVRYPIYPRTPGPRSAICRRWISSTARCRSDARGVHVLGAALCAALCAGKREASAGPRVLDTDTLFNMFNMFFAKYVVTQLPARWNDKMEFQRRAHTSRIHHWSCSHKWWLPGGYSHTAALAMVHDGISDDRCDLNAVRWRQEGWKAQ